MNLPCGLGAFKTGRLPFLCAHACAISPSLVWRSYDFRLSRHFVICLPSSSFTSYCVIQTEHIENFPRLPGCMNNPASNWSLYCLALVVKPSSLDVPNAISFTSATASSLRTCGPCSGPRNHHQNYSTVLYLNVLGSIPYLVPKVALFSAVPALVSLGPLGLPGLPWVVCFILAPGPI